MAHILSYRGYEGIVEFDPDGKVLRGKVLHIQDLVTFQTVNCNEVENEFQAAVDDYIDFCAEIGKDPDKPLSGQFNVRISPELHRKISVMAIKQDKSLNSVVTQAISNFVHSTNMDIEQVVNKASETVVSKMTQRLKIESVQERSDRSFGAIFSEPSDSHIQFGRGSDLWQ